MRVAARCPRSHVLGGETRPACVFSWQVPALLFNCLDGSGSQLRDLRFDCIHLNLNTYLQENRNCLFLTWFTETISFQSGARWLLSMSAGNLPVTSLWGAGAAGSRTRPRQSSYPGGAPWSQEPPPRHWKSYRKWLLCFVPAANFSLGLQICQFSGFMNQLQD